MNAAKALRAVILLVALVPVDALAVTACRGDDPLEDDGTELLAIGSDALALTVGLDPDDLVGARLEGDWVELLGRVGIGAETTAGGWRGGFYAAFDVDGSWTARQDTRDEIEAGAQLGFTQLRYTPMSADDPGSYAQLPGLVLECRGRYGQLDDDPATKRVSQTLVGAKLLYRLDYGWLNDRYADWSGGAELLDAPTLSAGYLTVHGTQQPAIPLPAQLEADHYYVRLEGMVPISLGATGWMRLGGLVQWSKPSAGAMRDAERYLDVSLGFERQGNSRSVKPAITYRTGTRDGLQYDKQLLIGIAWDLLKLGAKR